MNRHFHQELLSLRSRINQMGSMAVEAVRAAVASLLENDIALANAVIERDALIDQMEIDIDFEATRYITLRSPVASDLRILTIAIKTSHDLERVGDEAKSIAKKTRRILNRKGVHQQFFKLGEMAAKSQDMIYRALMAFIDEDVADARRLLDEDEEVNALNKANLRALIEASKDQPEEIETFLDLIFISKSLERIADHSTNLAEEVIYYKTAQDARQQNTSS